MGNSYVLYSFYEGMTDYSLWSDGSVTLGSWIKPGSGIQFSDSSFLTSSSGLALQSTINTISGEIPFLSTQNTFENNNIINGKLSIGTSNNAYQLNTNCSNSSTAIFSSSDAIYGPIIDIQSTQPSMSSTIRFFNSGQTTGFTMGFNGINNGFVISPSIYYAGGVSSNFFISHLGNIGINNNNPNYTLDVSGIANFSNGVYISGVSILSNLQLTGNTLQSQINSISGNVPFLSTQNSFSNNNTFQDNVYVLGALGVGFNNPSYTLDVSGSSSSTARFSSSDNTYGAILDIVSNNNKDSILRLYDSSNTGWTIGVNHLNNDFTISAGVGAPSIGVNNFVINQQGKVGIQNSSPQYQLDVSGSGNFTQGIYISGVSILSNLQLTGNTLQSQINSISGNVPFLSTQNSFSNNNTFQDNVYVLGALGVGFNNPSYTLDVSGSSSSTARFSSSDNTYGAILDIVSNNNKDSILRLYDSSNTGWTIGVNHLNNDFTISAGVGAPSISTNNFVINQQGKVGIQNSSPQYQLDVSGSGNFTQGIYINGVPVSTGVASLSGYITTGQTGNFASLIGNNIFSGNSFTTGNDTLSGNSFWYGNSYTSGNEIISGNISGYIFSGVNFIISGNSVVTTNQTGVFASIINLQSTGSTLQTLINTLNTWTGISTGLYYPYHSNPSGYSTSGGNTGQLTGIFYPLTVNPSGYAGTGITNNFTATTNIFNGVNATSVNISGLLTISGGTIIPAASISGAQPTGAYSIDWSKADHFYVTLSGNTSFNFLNTKDSMTIVVATHDTGKGYSVVFPTGTGQTFSGIKWSSQVVPSQTSGFTDVYTFTQFNTGIYASIVQAF